MEKRTLVIFRFKVVQKLLSEPIPVLRGTVPRLFG